MGQYFVYWKRGWQVLLFLVTLNIVLGVLYAGLAFALRPLTSKPTPIAALVVWLTVGAAFAGWWSEKSIAWSKRA